MSYSFAYAEEICSLAQKLIEDNELTDAALLIDRGVERFPGSPRMFLLSGKLRRKQGDLKRAEEALRRCLALSGTNEEALIELAELTTPSEGKALLLKAHNRNRGSTAVLRALTEWALRNSDLALAAECLGHWSKAGKSDDNCHLAFCAARIILQSGDRPGAKLLLRQLLDQRLLDSQGLETLLQISREDGSEEELVQTLKAAMTVCGPVKEIRNEFQRLNLKNRTVDSRLVVFVTIQPASRMLKMAKSVRESGFRAVLLYRNDGGEQSWRSYFDEIRQCGTADEMLFAAQDFNPVAFHVFSPMADEVSVAFVTEKPGPIIFDGYDFCEGMIWADYAPRVSQLQRFCMENADGLTCRDLRCLFLFREMNYRAPEHRIFFPDYCWDESEITARDATEIHVAAAGYIGTRNSGEDDWGHCDMGRYLAAAGIHFHIYPHPMQSNSPNFTEVFSDLIQLESETPFFHIHHSVSMDAISVELAKYHFGVNVLWPLALDQEMSSYSASYHRFCSSARNIEYLDAGLVTIVNRRLGFQYWLFDRKGVAVDGCLDFFKNPRPILEHKLAEPDLYERIRRFRRAHSIRANTPRLIHFYQQVRAGTAR